MIIKDNKMKKTVNKRKKRLSVKAAEGRDILLRGNDELDMMIDDLQVKFPMLEKRAAIVRYAVKQLHRKAILNNINPK